MVATGIERTPTEAERASMQIVGTKTFFGEFSKKLAEKEQEYAKKHEPYDHQCARADFQNMVEDAQKESERVYGYVRDEDIEKIEIDLEKYGDKDRFKIDSDDEEVEMQTINNVRTAVKTGHTIKYVCKQRGHGVSVFIPTEIYEERFGEKKKVRKEER